MAGKPATVQEYFDQLPDDRREALKAIWEVIRKNIDKKFEEGIQYGLPGYYLPHSVYPDGYHCDPRQPLPFASLASQKNHIGIYLFCVYTSPEAQEWLTTQWKKTGKKLDMGKSCIRVKKLEDVPLGVLGKLIKRIKAKDFLASYKARFVDGKPARKKPAKKTSARKKPARKKVASKAKAVARP